MQSWLVVDWYLRTYTPKFGRKLAQIALERREVPCSCQALLVWSNVWSMAVQYNLLWHDGWALSSLGASPWSTRGAWSWFGQKRHWALLKIIHDYQGPNAWIWLTHVASWYPESVKHYPHGFLVFSSIKWSSWLIADLFTLLAACCWHQLILQLTWWC